MNKPKIFLIVDTYLPGYRGGGPTQSVKNLVNTLAAYFDFYIFTSNHDFGISRVYNEVETDNWNDYEGAKIFYSSDQFRFRNLRKILTRGKFDLILLNSFFNKDTIRVILLEKILKVNTPIVLMPRGELSFGALNIKKLKKIFYIKFAKFTGMLKNIKYFTTAQDEYEQVVKILNTSEVFMVSNIPNTQKELILNTKEEGKLKVVFLSRITPKKNLDYALKSMKNCKKDIVFDIYGTLEEKKYWNECLEIIKKLPNNIEVNYRGEIRNEEVISTLALYDVFYLPTKSENYGHVISEALQSSIPVLISDQTPWRNLKEKTWGWDFNLINDYQFSSKIDELAQISQKQYNSIKQNIFEKFEINNRVEKETQRYIFLVRKIISEN